MTITAPNQKAAARRLRPAGKTEGEGHVVFHIHETAYAKARGNGGSWPFQGTAAPVVRGRGCRGWPGQTTEGSTGHVRESHVISNGKPLKSLQQGSRMNRFRIWKDLSSVSGRTDGRVSRESSGTAIKRHPVVQKKTKSA